MIKKILVFALAGCMLLFAGCKTSINETNKDENKSDRVKIEEMILTSPFQYPATNDLFYYNVYEDYVAITKYIGEATKNVAIPDTIEDRPVYVIADNAFEEALLVTIQITKNVYVIEANAFEDCPNLETVTFTDAGKLPEDVIAGVGVVTIEDKAFSGCESLRRIDLPDSVETLGKSVFYKCVSLEEIAIPPLVTIIPDKLCYGCVGLKDVYIGETVYEIDPEAFEKVPVEAIFHGKEYSAAARYAADHFFEFVVEEESDPSSGTK